MVGNIQFPTLWGDEKLHLSPMLVQAYTNVINSAGLWQKSQDPRPDPPPIGGLSQEQTDDIVHIALMVRRHGYNLSS